MGPSINLLDLGLEIDPPSRNEKILHRVCASNNNFVVLPPKVFAMPNLKICSRPS